SAGCSLDLYRTRKEDRSLPKRYGYREIASELRSRINAGELPPGGKVPGENELMAQYGVEQLTARRALDVLKNEGLIVARRGSGTYVREFRPIRRVSPDRLRVSVWGSGRSVWSSDVEDRPVADDVQVTQEQAPAHIAHVLDLEPDATVTVRRRQYLVEGRPVQLAASYYPADLVDGSPITEIDTGPGGSYARLEELGHKPTRFREELRARMPQAEEIEALQLSQGTPVIEVVRTAYDAARRVVGGSEMVLDAGSYLPEYKFSAREKKKKPPPRPGKGPRRGRMLFVFFGMFRRAEAVRRLLRWRRWRLRRPDTLEVELDQLSPEKVESEPHDRPDFANAMTTSSRATNPY